MKLKNLNESEYKEYHIKIHNDLDSEFLEVIKQYNSFGMDNTNKSEIIRMLIRMFVNEFQSNSNGEYEIFKMLKNYRVDGVQNE